MMLGIEYTVFDYGGNGTQKKKILEFRGAPGNIRAGLNVLSSKLDIDDVKEQMNENRKRIMQGTIKKK